jgi:hypothetical protein
LAVGEEERLDVLDTGKSAPASQVLAVRVERVMAVAALAAQYQPTPANEASQLDLDNG